MTVRRVAATAAALALTGMGVFGVQAPAAAHHKPGHSGGPGSNCDKPDKPTKYPPAQCTRVRASASDVTLTPGQGFQFFAEGFAAGTVATITMFSTPVVLGTARADAFDFFAKDLETPVDATVGAHRLVATGQGADGARLSLTVHVTVSRPSATAGGTENSGTSSGGSGPSFGGIPRTGTEIALVGLTGVALVLVGGAAIIAGRRRQFA